MATQRQQRRWLTIACGGLGGIVLIALLWYLVSVGLDRADKLGSVVGAFTGLMGLGVAIHGLLNRIDLPPTPPSADDVHRFYVDAFLAVNRCPEWNKELCSVAQTESIGIHYTPVDDDNPPAFAEHLYKLGRGLIKSRRESLSGIAKRLTGSTDNRNITVLLGDPGAGKSSFAVQLVHVVARRRRNGLASELPIYVNLAHFDHDYTPTAEGLERFVVDAVSQACPRHQKRSAGAERLRRIGTRLVAGLEDTGALVVLDSMDEMPVKDYVERVKAIAGFMDDPRREGFTFVVTCRYADFVRLRDHTTNLRLQRWDLLPWTRQMARDYLRSIDVGGARQAIKDLVADNREFCDPLEVALRAKLGTTGAGAEMHEVWDQYLEVRLGSELPRGLTAEYAVAELARFAFDQRRPDPEVIEAARRSGLLRESPHGLVFEIRPLEHHLAGKELLRRVKASGALPDTARLDDINVREVVKNAGAQAGADPQWTAAIRSALAAAGGKRTRGDRLSVAAHALSRTQIASSDELRNQLVDLIRAQVQADDVERIRCLEALERQPALLDPSLISTRRLFEWIAEHGSRGAVSWLLELFLRDRALRRQYRDIGRQVVGRTLDQGSFSTQVQFLLSRFLPNRGPVRFILGRMRIVMIGSGYYLSYLTAWTAAFLVLFPIHHGLRSGWFGAQSWLQGQGLMYLVVSIWTARSLLRGRVQEELGAQRWWARFIGFLSIMFGLRIVWGLAILLGELPHRWWMPHGHVLLFAVPFVLAVAVIILLELRTRTSPRVVSRTAPARRAVEPAAKARPQLTIGAAVATATVLTFMLSGGGWAAVVGLGGLVAFAIEVIFLGPLREARKTKRRVLELARKGLSKDLHATVAAILEKILDEDMPVLVRNSYVDALTEVHFDDELLDELERCYAQLPPGPVHDRLTEVVLRAHHEYRKQGRFGLDR